jgi:hypothetical protein
VFIKIRWIIIVVSISPIEELESNSFAFLREGSEIPGLPVKRAQIAMAKDRAYRITQKGQKRRRTNKEIQSMIKEAPAEKEAKRLSVSQARLAFSAQPIRRRRERRAIIRLVENPQFERGIPISSE